MPTVSHVERVVAIRSSLPASHEWSERELELLDLAEAQAADVDRLEADIEETGVRMANGRLNQAIGEVRQGRVALGRLLGLIDIPEDMRPAQAHGRRAAEARWKAAD